MDQPPKLLPATPPGVPSILHALSPIIKSPMFSGATSYGSQPSEFLPRLHTIYFVVPNDRVDTAAKGISAYLPYYQRSPATQLVLPNCNYPVDFPDIPVLQYPPFRIGIIPENLVAFDPTDTTRITTIECDHTSIPVPGLLDSCADVFRIHLPQLPKRLSILEWILGRTMADLQREYDRKLALHNLAGLADYCIASGRRRGVVGGRLSRRYQRNTAGLPSVCDLRTANASLTSS